MAEDLPIPEYGDELLRSYVRAWAEDKYRLLYLYDKLFSRGIKNKWTHRVYIDLFSGPGQAFVQGSGRLLWGSPILALSVQDKFDKYIFCDSSASYVDALRKRVDRLFPTVDVSYVVGDCNEKVEEVCRHIPKASKDNTVLSFCFVDPFNLRVKFSTIRRIADHFVDFLVLLALHMDANRNVRLYTNPKNRRIDDFLGQSEWRSRWSSLKGDMEFPRFLAEEYAQQMQALGYLSVPFHRMKQIRSDERNLPLYHLALFSRNELASKYWDQVLKYSTPQRGLWD